MSTLSKNVANQTIYLFARNLISGFGRSGDALNITALVSVDGDTPTCLPIPIEVTPGVYAYTPAQARTNGAVIIAGGSSITPNTEIRPVFLRTEGFFKNTANQKIPIYAHDNINGGGEPGQALTILAVISKDGAAAAVNNDTNPTELVGIDGAYLFDMNYTVLESTDETNADELMLKAVSSNNLVQIDPVTLYTVPAVVTTASGIYAVQSDLERKFGTENIRLWSNLDNADLIANVLSIQAALDYAENVIEDRFRNGRYVLPFNPKPKVVKEWTTCLAGAWLYSNRGFDDQGGEAGEESSRLTRIKDAAHNEIDAYTAGSRQLNVDLNFDAADSPTVVAGVLV